MQQRAGWTQEHAHEERHYPQANGGTEEGLPPERFAFVFLPMLAVFTVKPGEPGEVFKCRLVSCGNKTDETYGDISTNEMDVALMRFLLFFWGVRFRGAKNSFVSIDISTAFLNAELLEGRIVVVKPPACLYQLGLVPPGTVWRLHKALYGLRESPSLWAGERTKRLKSLEVTPANSSPVTSSTPALFILVCGLLSRRRTCSGRSPRKGLRMFFYPSRPQRCLRPSLCFCG